MQILYRLDTICTLHYTTLHHTTPLDGELVGTNRPGNLEFWDSGTLEQVGSPYNTLYFSDKEQIGLRWSASMSQALFIAFKMSVRCSVCLEKVWSSVVEELYGSAGAICIGELHGS